MSYVVCDILASYCNGNWINLYIQNLILAACILAAAWRTNPSCLFSKWSKHSPSQDTGSVRVWRPHHRDVASAILHHLWPLQCRAALLRAQHRGSWIKKETKQEKRGLKPVFLSAKKKRSRVVWDVIECGTSRMRGRRGSRLVIKVQDLKKNTKFRFLIGIWWDLKKNTKEESWFLTKPLQNWSRDDTSSIRDSTHEA